MNQWRRAVALAPVLLIALAATPIGQALAIPARQETEVTCSPIAPVNLPGTVAIQPAAVATPGTAAATPVASPVADAAAAALGRDLELVVRTVAACQSTGRVKGLTRFVTDQFLGDYYAGGGSLTAQEFVEFAPSLPRVRVAVHAVSSVTFDPRGTATAEVTSIVGKQLMRAAWSFRFAPSGAGDETGGDPTTGNWLADGVSPLPAIAPANAETVRLRMVDNAYRPAALTATGPNVVIAASNGGDDDHELLVLKLKKGVTTDALLAEPGPELPAGVSYVGQLTIPAGEDGTMVLIGLSAGEYAIVDLLLDASGTPHLALGMEAKLTVE